MWFVTNGDILMRFPYDISSVVTVFEHASAFNRDINLWDVAKVTTMESSKSIRIVKNDLTRRELMAIVIGGFHRGCRLVVMM